MTVAQVPTWQPAKLAAHTDALVDSLQHLATVAGQASCTKPLALLHLCLGLCWVSAPHAITNGMMALW